MAALSPSPAKECRDCVGPGHDVCYEHPPAVEKPPKLKLKPCPDCAHKDEAEPECAKCDGRGVIPVAPVESLTEGEGECAKNGCVDGKRLDYNPRSGEGKEYPCPKCAPGEGGK